MRHSSDWAKSSVSEWCRQRFFPHSLGGVALHRQRDVRVDLRVMDVLDWLRRSLTTSM